MKIALVIVLAAALLATGCNADWISVALEDLPVLTQMALNLGTVVSGLESGQQISAAEAAAIQNISAQASHDLNLLQSLCNEYKQNPSATTVQKIQDAIGDINQNLPAMLQAAHISNAVLSAKIAAGVSLILTTVNGFALLIPQSSTAGAVVGIPRLENRETWGTQKAALPHAADLKKHWNQHICGASGDAGVDAALTACAVGQ
jgi:hypothetical protein